MFDKEPEDIFAKTDAPVNLPTGRPAVTPITPAQPVEPAGANKASAPTLPPPVPTPAMQRATPVRTMATPPQVTNSRTGLVKAIVVFIIVAAIIAVAALITYLLLFKPTDVLESNETPINAAPEATPAATTSVPAVTPTPEATPKIVDSDGDGLSDAQEIEIGTDVDVADTDSDGLSDREEALVYDTNPIDPDTDGDGYEDGAEVTNGYNPNGPGKLFAVPN